MKIKRCKIPDVLIIKPIVYEDSRGNLMETYRKDLLEKYNIFDNFVLEFQSKSTKNTIRGMHYQINPHPQAKLIRIIKGRILDIVVDIRAESPFFGQYVTNIVSATNRVSVYIPEGFAHGFLVLSNEAEMLYKLTNFYNPECERRIIWNDPQINIKWPVENPILSEKDKMGKKLSESEVLFNEGHYSCWRKRDAALSPHHINQ